MKVLVLLVALLLSPSQKAQDSTFFQSTEQALMDAITTGDKSAWDRVMDPACVVTTEEGEVLSKSAFLKELNGLPPGLSGNIKVVDLTVQEFPEFAVVRFRLEEDETVFGQLLKTQYRVTDTFRKTGADWKMIASHVSVVTLDPPEQAVSKKDWPGLVGDYRLLPNGWTFHVVLQDGKLLGGRDPKKLRLLIPMAPNVFVVKGTLGEWIFVPGDAGKASKIVALRKFEPLVWTRVE